MSDNPNAPQPATTSVVVDTNAKVKVPHTGILVAAVVAVALVAFSGVWFAVHDNNSYEPGEFAKGMMASVEQSGADVQFSDDELRCVDDAGKGLDPALFDGASMDMVGGLGANQDAMASIGRVMDCITGEHRVAISVASLLESGFSDDEAAIMCLAEAEDAAFVDAGGYEAVLSSPQGGMTELMSSVFGAITECGIDPMDMMQG
jgi:hypothetical protein